MTKQEIEAYLDSRAEFRRRTAEKSRPGTSAAIKNELYAYALERVIEYVKQLPDDDPRLVNLEAIDYDALAYNDAMHANTIHCSLGKPPRISEWFATWSAMVVGSVEGGAV